jgi:hypothetical protein
MSEATIQVAPARFVTIDLASACTGLTEKAIRKKIEDGVWTEGMEYRRQVDDKRIYIDLQGYAKWVERGRVLNYAKSPSASGSSGKASGAARP